ncbi:MAG TPA: DUF58 domain-containing protein [Phycisphaerae bacterium]|nr:DUF58 domain-containing protein [Phycisphaerales bacterium]HRX84710.1 DUF58 domain-containing protein [Phycisphaerae bacterium]
MAATTSYFHPEVLNKIRRLELRARHVVEGFLSGLHQSPYKGFSVEFADHRAYVPGDDLRHIDWRVYAKADRLFIKEYEVETNLRTYLLLDGSASMAYPEHPVDGRMTKWEYAATLAASLAYLLVQQQDGAGLMLFDSAVRTQLPVSSNRANLHRLVDVLERSRPEKNTDTKVLFRYLADQLPRRSMVIILSDLLTDVGELIEGLARFRFSRHDVLVLHVLDHDEIEFPFTDRTLFEGMEQTDLEVLTDPQALRSAYRQRVQEFITQVRGACLNQQIEYALVSTADPLDVALTRFLADRLRRTRSRA